MSEGTFRINNNNSGSEMNFEGIRIVD